MVNVLQILRIDETVSFYKSMKRSISELTKTARPYFDHVLHVDRNALSSSDAS